MIRLYMIAVDTPEPLTGWSAGAKALDGAIEVVDVDKALVWGGADWGEVLDELLDVLAEGKPPGPAGDGPIPYDQFAAEVTVEERMQ